MKTPLNFSFRKTAFLYLLIAIIIGGGCGKKNNDGPGDTNYYISFKAGNAAYTYKGYPYATFSQSDDTYLGGFGAFSSEGNGTKNVVSVLTGSLKPIAVNTYTGVIKPGSGGETPAVFLSYIDEQGKTFANLYKDNATNIVTITALSATSVKGTFSGKIYDVQQTNAPAIGFSGEFYVQRVK